jgi:hypothetical protein
LAPFLPNRGIAEGNDFQEIEVLDRLRTALPGTAPAIVYGVTGAISGKARRELSTAQQILPDVNHGTLESVVRRIAQVLGERRVNQLNSPAREEPRPTKPLIVLRPDQCGTAAVVSTVQQTALAPGKLDKKARMALRDAYKAECAAHGVKVGREEIGLAVKPNSKDPVTLVKKWLACDPRYEVYTPLFLKVFAENPTFGSRTFPTPRIKFFPHSPLFPLDSPCGG